MLINIDRLVEKCLKKLEKRRRLELLRMKSIELLMRLVLVIFLSMHLILQYLFDFDLERDAYPSPLNYYNFPKSCCTSVNEVICHGMVNLV